MSDSEDSPEPQPKLSKYNAAIAQLIRMDSIYQDCHKHSRGRDYDSWNEDLDAIWRELAGDIEEESEHFAKMGLLNTQLRALFPLIKPNFKGFNQPAAGDIVRAQKQKAILAQKEVFLRRLQNILGKGTAYDEDDDDFE